MDQLILVQLKLLLKGVFVPRSSLKFNTFNISTTKVILK